ncbi:MAG TPA: hypothetical protein VF228_11895 [Iamia sp.]
MADAGVIWSVSSWQQPLPAVRTPARAAVVDRLAALVVDGGPGRQRVVFDGLTAAGKTSLAHEVGAAVAALGRPVLRASLDDFKRPWADRHLYDRESGEGYYRNAGDHDAAWRLLLAPAAPNGSGVVALCALDPLTQVDHSTTTVTMPDDGVLVVDSVFALRPELDDAWDLRIWVDVDPELSVARGVGRDSHGNGPEAAESLHRQRYLVGEQLYLAEVDPIARADVVVDNRDLDHPVVVRAPGPAA